MPDRNFIGALGVEFADIVRRERKRHGFTQPGLAERVTDTGRPMSAVTISAIERGKRHVDLDDFVALVSALGLDVFATRMFRETIRTARRVGYRDLGPSATVT